MGPKRFPIGQEKTSFDNGSRRKSILLPQWYQRHWKRINKKLKDFPESFELCGKPERLYKKSLKVCLWTTEEVSQYQVENYSSKAYRFSIDNTSQVSCTSLSFGEVNGKWVGAQPRRSAGADEIDYELHLGTNLDFIIYFNTKQLRNSEMTLLQNQCELERTQMSTILMLAIKNTKIAGYTSIGKRSMFLHTDESVTWLYHCPKFLSPLRVLDRCYDQIPICLNGLQTF